MDALRQHYWACLAQAVYEAIQASTNLGLHDVTKQLIDIEQTITIAYDADKGDAK